METEARARNSPGSASRRGTASKTLRNVQASPHDFLRVDELLASIRGGIERVSLGAEQARQTEREQPQLHVA